MTTFYFLSGENIDWFAHAGANNTAEVDLVDVAIALAHVQLAKQELAGKLKNLSAPKEISHCWRPDFVHGIPS